MNSAAKLRNRSVATLAASALLIGGLAPAALAYYALPNPTLANQAGAASIGLTDTNPNTPGTQGAVAVTPGGSGQDMGQVKFVLPSKWQAGDTVEFAIAPTGGITAANRVSFSSASVTVDPQAYDETTHVEDANGATNGAGEVNGGALTKYTPTGTDTPAVTPAFTQTVVSTGAGNYRNVVRVTFTNDSDPLANRAKFIATLDGKIDVGTGVTGAISLTAAGVDTTTTGDNGTLEFLGMTTGDEPRNVTYPAAVLPASLDVQNGSVVADGSNQNVGPLTVTAANGTNFTDGQTVEVTLNGATFSNDPVTVNAYNAAGTLVDTDTTVVPVGNTIQYDIPASGAYDVARVVFTNPMVTAPRTGGSLTYTLTDAGGLTLVASPLGGTGAPTHQTDIQAPSAVTATQPVASDLPDRIGGQDRYQTAVKIAERALGTNPTDGPVGESDNVVIASGEGFADALSAGYLAATKNAQLILTRQGSLPQTDIEFLKTYGAKNIFIVGGTGSVSKAVEDQLKSLTSYDVQAADGAERPADVQAASTYNVVTGGETGAVTAGVSDNTGSTAALPATNTVVLVRDADGADNDPATTADNGAITGATVNGSSAGVVVTTPGTATTAGAITWTIYGQTYTIPTAADNSTTGSFTATSTEVPGVITTGTEPLPADEATGSNRKLVPLSTKLTVTRLAGSDRFETNRKVNEYAGATSINPVGSMTPEYGKPRAKTAMVANGMLPWDALSAGPLVGRTGGATQYPVPLILTAGSALNTNAKTQMQTLDIENTLFIGGSGVLPDSNMTEAENLGAYTQRISGADRWATAAAVSDFALRDAAASTTNKFPGLGLGAQRPYLANGGSMAGNTGTVVAKGAWADALAAGPSAAADGRIIALTDSAQLPAATADLLKRHSADLAKPVIAVGLGGVISTETVNAANAALGG